MLPKTRKTQWNLSKYRRIITMSFFGIAMVSYFVFLLSTTTDSTTSYLQHIDSSPAYAKEKSVKGSENHPRDTRLDAGFIRSSTTDSSTTTTQAIVTVAPSKSPKQETTPQEQQHAIAGLSCEAHGGPIEEEALREMVYWKDIPSDASYISPLQQYRQSSPKYFTFEPDEGGFNNIRMAMETAIALAISMGRTLVLPPKMKFYLIPDGVVDYGSFFHIDSIAAEHGHFDIISFEEFLQREAMTGNLRDQNGTVSFPPHQNRTDWNGAFNNYMATRGGASKDLWEWMRTVTQPLDWKPDQCVAGFPSNPINATARLHDYVLQVLHRDSVKFPTVDERNRWAHRIRQFTEQPLAPDATPINRLSEILAHRKEICVYNETYQNARVVHGIGETKTGYRLLIHWYAYLFFEDWHQDLHMKRFLRDHFRYKDEIQCAAARIIQAVREKTKEHGNNDFDTMHIRRGDFQYKSVRLEAEEIYENNTKSIIPVGSTVYIATDERNRTFFEPLAAKYKLLFFSDFAHLVTGVNSNYYGMLDQLVASKGRVFVGTYYSTFTGYINRLRGYHSQNKKAKGFEKGIIDSYYYAPQNQKSLRDVMRSYLSVQPAFWSQEFAAAWRLIDTGLDDEDIVSYRL